MAMPQDVLQDCRVTKTTEKVFRMYSELNGQATAEVVERA